MKLIIDIPNSLYANLKKIVNGSSASKRILDCVKNGTPYEPVENSDNSVVAENATSGDLISRSELKKAIDEYAEKRQDTLLWQCDIEEIIDNAPTVDTTEQEEFAYNEGYAHGLETKRPNEQIAWEQGYEAGLAQGKHDRPQITVFTESTDEKAIEDMKAELKNILDSERTQGEWVMVTVSDKKGGWKRAPVCNRCSCRKPDNIGPTFSNNFCPNCGAPMKKGGAE